MGLLLGALAVGTTAMVVSAAIAFVCDELSEREIRRQRQMQREYDEYEERRRSEYRQTYDYYAKAMHDRQNEYEQEIKRYNLELIQRRKRENRKYYDNRIKLLAEQKKEKQNLHKDCLDIISVCEKSIQNQQSTYLRFKSIKTTVISLEEAAYKLAAYLEYLDLYRKRMDEEFENTGDLIEPFSLTLPKGYPYEGQLLFLEPGKFVNGGYVFEDLGFVRIDKNDEDILNTVNNQEYLPFLLYTYKRRGDGREKKYLSYSKGMLKKSIGGTLGIDVEIKEIRPKYINLSFMKNNFLHLRIDKSDLKNQRRKTPVGSNLHVYVTDYDYALKDTIQTSERVSDGLNIAQFDSIIMLQTEQEKEDFYKYLEDNNLLDYDDEWRIAPIWNDDKSDIDGIIMQVGTEYAFRACFEEFEIGKIVLKYKERLEKEKFVTFDDVFVSANVTVDVLAPSQVKESIGEYEDLFEECQKLQLYLVSEFTTQNKMMINSPMNLYLNQWTEITNRLIEVLSVGRHISLRVCEFEKMQIMGETYTFVYVDNNDELIKYYEREIKEGRKKYYIQFTEYDRFMCRLEVVDEIVIVKVKGNITAEDLLELDFQLEMYSIANPYAEKQQVLALDSFREGRIVNEALKMAIVNIASEAYSDNEYRITELHNQNIADNGAQLDSVIRAFAEEKFFMIQGPPGTGKTTVIKELILQQLDARPHSKILVVSQSNVAVDNVLRGIVAITKETNLVDDKQIVRCGDIEKIAEDLLEYAFEKKYVGYRNQVINSLQNDSMTQRLKQKWISIIEDTDNADIVGECLLGCFQIIGATCVGLENRKYGLSGINFDLVIIDEAGKALPGELLIPLNRAQKAIIIGDHKQLPPVINPALYKGGVVEYDDVVDGEQQVDFLNRSFFQRLYEDCPDNMKGMLKTQFRMPPVIAGLVNMFYDGQLMTGGNCYKKEPIFLNNNLLFIDMKNEKDYFETQEVYGNNQKSSPYNEKEIEAVQAIVKRIKEYYKGRIVIITPYKKQKNKMIKAIRDKSVWINTIDAFQGDEENIVIFCMTRAKQPTKYFSDSARLNVAFSRAKNTLIILGSSNYFYRYSKEHEMQSIGKYIEQNACIIEYLDFIDSNYNLLYNSNYIEKHQEEVIAPCVVDNMSRFFESVSEKKEVGNIAVCECCGENLQEEESVLCRKCLTKSITTNCACCNGEIVFPAYDKYIRKIDTSEVCEQCIKTKCEECGKEVLLSKYRASELKTSGKKQLCGDCIKLYSSFVVVKCEECGNEIKYRYSQKKSFEEQGMELPHICYNCRTVEVGRCVACSRPIIERERITKKTGYLIPLLHRECRDSVWKNVNCQNCGETFSISFGEKIYLDDYKYTYPSICKKCKDARKEDVRVGTCCACGEGIYQRGDLVRRYGMPDVIIHKDCKNNVYINRNCKICGDLFSITYGEKMFFENKGFNLPTKCKDCR